MSGAVRFVKTTALGGLVAVVPAAVLVVLVLQIVPALDMLAGLAGQILPFDPVTNLILVTVLALTLLLLVGFVAGLFLRTRLVKQIDEGLARIVPVYGIVRNLSKRIAGMEGSEFAPAEIDLLGNSTRVLGAVVEELSDGRCVVFVPQAPMVTFGQIYVVPRERVTPLPGTMADAFGAVTQWGVGTARLYDRKSP
jgi:uncharacterized membrane protein